MSVLSIFYIHLEGNITFQRSQFSVLLQLQLRTRTGSYGFNAHTNFERLGMSFAEFDWGDYLWMYECEEISVLGDSYEAICNCAREATKPEWENPLFPSLLHLSFFPPHLSSHRACAIGMRGSVSVSQTLGSTPVERNECVEWFLCRCSVLDLLGESIKC